MKNTKISALLKKSLDLVSPETTLEQAVREMLRVDCDVLPVGRNGALIGVVTGDDILASVIARGENPMAERVQDHAFIGIPWCHQQDTVFSAAKKMQKSGTRYLAVKDASGNVVGILFRKWLPGQDVESIDIQNFLAVSAETAAA